MARIIADALDGELDVILVRKLGAPDNPEFAIGAIDERGELMLDAAAVEWSGADRDYLQREASRQLALIRTGRPIMTVFDSVEQNVRFKYNGRHPYRIVTKWRNPISGEMVTFRSNDLWDDPTEEVKHRSITVLVNPTQLSHYVMDLSMLQKQKDR